MQTSFGGGEFSPLLNGQVDLDRYKQALEKCFNYIPSLQGGLVRRSGTKYVQGTKAHGAARLLPFEFSTTQAYILEFGDQYIRFFRNNAPITLSALTITGATAASPVVITSVAHGLSNGDKVIIQNVGGMIELNNREFTVANVASDTFELSGINGLTYTAYTAGGTAAEIYEISSPYLAAHLFQLRITQSADVLYITHPSYAPRTLSRTAHTTWTLAEIDFLDGPYLAINNTTTSLTPSAATGTGVTLTASAVTGINNGTGFAATDVGRLIRIREGSTWGYVKITGWTSTTVVTVTVINTLTNTNAKTFWRMGVWSGTSGYPAVVTFHEDRLFFGGATGAPQRIDASVTSEYANFAPSDTAGTVSATNALSFTFNANDVNVLRWIISDEKGLLVGTAGGEWLVRPSSAGEALTPTNITAKRSTKYGSANVQALQVGKSVLFIQKAGRKVRELTYFFDADGFRATDVTLLAEHITQTGIVEMAVQNEPQPILWCVREDGDLAAVTYERDVDSFKVGWHRHQMGGDSDAAGTPAVVESVAVIPGAAGTRDELWLVVNRRIDGGTKRFIEYLTPLFDDEVDQKDAFFVDGGQTYDAPVTISGITLANPAVVTATSHGFLNGDKVLLSDIFGLNDSESEEDIPESLLEDMSVLVKNKTTHTFEITDLDGVNIDTSTGYTAYVSGGEARLYIATVSGLWHLKGQTVDILGDGAVQPSQVVDAHGEIILDVDATTVQMGLGYKSDGKMLRLNAGAADGTAIGKTQRTHRVGVMLHRSLGLKLGTNFDELDELTFRTAADAMGRAPALFTGILSQELEADYDFENQLCFRQDQPLPSMLLALMPQMHTQDR